MWKLALVIGLVVAVVAGVKETGAELTNTDAHGRVSMPGAQTLRLGAGDYSLYYEVPGRTPSRVVFEPPPGIRVKVRGLGDLPDPVLERGGAGNQVGTDSTTAESFAKLKVERAGSYRLVAGRPPGGRPSITVGDSGSATLGRGLALAGRILAIAAGIAGLLFLIGFARRRAVRTALSSYGEWASTYTPPGADDEPPR